MHFYSAAAFKELQRVQSGEYRWSKLLGAWAGSGTYAARGVPERFLNPARCPTQEEVQRIERKREEKAKLKLQQAEDEKKAKEEAAAKAKEKKTGKASGMGAPAEGADTAEQQDTSAKTEGDASIKAEASTVAT